MNKNIISAVVSTLLIISFPSCSSQLDTEEHLQGEVSKTPQTCEAVMNISKAGFEDEPETRSASSWSNGDTVYLVFDSEGNSYGDAVYQDGKWQLTFFGSLATNATTPCQAVYIENQTEEIGTVIKCNQNSAIYEASTAQYIYDGTTLTVTASLSPKTGRIRFDGSDGTQFKLYGISYYTSFDSTTGQFSSTPGMISCSVKDTSTAYIYGFYSDAKEPRINVIYTASAFTKQLPVNIYQAGESGYLTLPTEDSHSGWRNRAIFNINGVDLTMIPVEYENGNFLLAETEMTEALYYAVMEEGDSSQLPKIISYGSRQNFFTKIYNAMGLDFRLPTLTEWRFAFAGGNKSQGYKYSGSDDIYAVAWFSENSDGEKHPVKQLQPNELGFYDMSGNVSEDVSGGYSYGGDYDSNASYCTSEYFTTYADCGTRIAMTNE